jgi:hypothetical protein
VKIVYSYLSAVLPDMFGFIVFLKVNFSEFKIK